MKRELFIILGLILIFYPALSQNPIPQKPVIIFQGIVIDAGSLSPLGGTQMNINRAFSGYSKDDGKFAIGVMKGDTVLFSRLGYKAVQMLVSDTLTGSEFITGIYMNPDTLSAGEIVIVPRMGNLKSDIIRPRSEINAPLENAKYNLALSAYQAKVTQSQLGDPAINYEVIRQKQSADAYTKGQIPADKMIGLSPLLLIPAAYLLLNGLPEKPTMPEPVLSNYEIDQLNRKYLQSKRK